ncbi:FKBP-type peptidyl-prolyl cis-trans isomerase [Imhoffiella purpurea]|uniref:peptidylprolyl isomerase n=1 Tax=Imhoffiella purpurea TaxID=1249627 RepID=W9V2C3_9GAMM|nr:peptidylprolyl isomerase [Imhoffiella purpurea]EXJ13648.1 FKBP-type peptidyl-prolyl cis-trans isomerase SlpA [Imhoffiella purpurea]
MDRAAALQEPVIAPGREVSLHLEVCFENGFEALSTFGEEPICCRIGDGSFTSAFESLIAGLAAGTETQLSADGSELFGVYDEANLHWVGSDDFPEDRPPLPGQLVAFTTPGGHDTSGIILARNGERILVDFNHPFSGRRLRIRIKVLAVG